VSGPALEENLEALAAEGGFLHTSPEFALKRVLAAGLPRIYAIVPCFRAEEIGRHHATEFTMLELYLSNASYLDLLPVVEELVAAAARAVGHDAPGFVRRTVASFFDGNIPADDDAFYLAWVDRIEPGLTEPTFVLDYPARQAALAEVRGDIAERVEVYLAGMELGNGFSELRDSDELRARFERSGRARASRGRAPHPVDAGVIEATGRLPRCAGIAIGVDRLVMALTGADDIADVRIPR
jgi:lysyl-tRNA synthetase class 2